jgi:hypothetical protein
MFDSDATKPRSGFARLYQIKLPLWVTLLLLIVVAGSLGAAHFALEASKDRGSDDQQALSQQLEADKATLRADARASNDAAYRLFGNALAWAVRSAMMRRNLDEIEQYFSVLISDPRIRLVVFADPKGKILVTSNRQLQHAQFTAHFPAALLQTPEVAIQPGDAGLSRLVLPIQGLNKRLGTVLVIYTQP